MSQAPLGEALEDVKPKLNLKIGFEGQQITVKVKANMKFGRIFDAATRRFEKEPGTLRFMYDDKRIQESDTPAALDMEDDDLVDAFLEQLGGSLFSISPSS